MKIQIDGTGNINKGAELMLYSILEQIELKFPDSIVVFNSNAIGRNKIDTNLNLIKPTRIQYSRYIRAILSRFKISYVYFTPLYPKRNIDVVLDASGFKFGDQWDYSENYYRQLEHYYQVLKRNNTKIILLPQAFGPFEKHSSKKVIAILNSYVDLIIAREPISMSYLVNAGINKNKLLQYPDFTIKTKGDFPIKYEALKGGVCIIPNNKMLSHTQYSKDQYFKFYDIIINELNKNNKVFLLNHEGKNDLTLCQEIKKRFDFEIPIVFNINAKEIKGIINESKLVVSSRFHGVASALSQAIPCLATSWSHKYELLLKDYGFENHILKIHSNPKIITKEINHLLQPQIQKNIKTKLKEKAEKMNWEIENMWLEIWKILDI